MQGTSVPTATSAVIASPRDLLPHAAAPRIAVGSIEAVRRLVATGQFVGSSINWIRVRGNDWEEHFHVRPLQMNRPNLQLWLCHSANWDATGPAGLLATRIKAFFERERRIKDKDGRWRSMIWSLAGQR